MRKAVRIGVKSPYPFYMPKDLVDEGFVGDTDMVADAKTVTIFHPKANIEEISESLKIVLRDICLRRGKIIKFEEEDIEKK